MEFQKDSIGSKCLIIFQTNSKFSALKISSKLPEVKDMIKIMKFVKTNRNLIPLNEIYYSPDNPVVNQLMSIVKKVTRLGLKAVNDSTVLQTAIARDNPFVGVEFSNSYTVTIF